MCWAALSSVTVSAPLCRGGNELPRPDLIDFRLCYRFTQPKTIRRNHYECRPEEPSNKEPPVSGEVPDSRTLLHGYRRLAIPHHSADRTRRQHQQTICP